MSVVPGLSAAGRPVTSRDRDDDVTDDDVTDDELVLDADRAFTEQALIRRHDSASWSRGFAPPHDCTHTVSSRYSQFTAPVTTQNSTFELRRSRLAV